MLRHITTVLVVATLLAPAAAAYPVDTTNGVLDFGFTDDDNQVDGSVSGAFSMDAETGASGTGVAVGNGTLWVARAPSDVSFTIEEGTTVEVHLAFSRLSNLQNVTVQVGEWSDGPGFESMGEETIQSQDIGLTGATTFSIDVAEHTIEQGDRPAVRVNATLGDTLDGEAIVDTGRTQAHYLDTPPPENYPTPETSSGILTGVGLLAVLGIVRFRRDGT